MAAFDTSSTTSLPSWFTNAQQNAAQGVTAALNNATQPGQTVAQPLVQSLNTPNNPFSQGIANLADIATSATNPWLATGAPDTSSALGGLFAAQNAKLDQILPSIAAKEGAAGIASGNYGGLRGQTAVGTAKAGALTTLAEQQDQAALNALTQGIQANTAIGNLGSQYGTTGINVANWQQLGALPAYTQAATALGNIGAKTDTTTSKNAGLSANVTSAANLAKNLGVAAGDIAAGKTGIGWLDSILKGATTPTGGLPAGTGTDAGVDYGVDYATNDQIPYGTGTDAGIDYGVDYATTPYNP